MVPHTGYNDTALTKQFYNMLPRRITDTFQMYGRPADLNGMIRSAQVADANYWREIDNSRLSTHPTQVSRRQQVTPTPAAPAVTSAPVQTRTPSAPSRLTDAERKRRMDNNLCLYCGETGHIRLQCPKRPESANPPPAAAAAPFVPRTGRATFTISPEASASIAEVPSASGKV